MRYEQIAQILRFDDPHTFFKLTGLHISYKDCLTRQTAKKYESDDPAEVALHVIDAFDHMHPDIQESFTLASMSYDELRKEQGIKKQRLTRKANIARRNLRGFLGMDRDADICQQEFDRDRIARQKSYIIIADKDDPTKGLSAFDVQEFHKKKRLAKFNMIASCLRASAVDVLGMKESFQSLTLDGEWHKCMYQHAHQEILERFSGMRRDCDRAGITWLGTYKIHLHENETPHIHIMSYVDPDRQSRFNDIVLKWFSNEAERIQRANKPVYDDEGVRGYLLHDFTQDDVRVGFIGLRRNILGVWDDIYAGRYGSQRLSYLSDRRAFLIRKIMRRHHYEGWRDIHLNFNEFVLFAMRGFRDNRLNELSKRHPDIDRVHNADHVYVEFLGALLHPVAHWMRDRVARDQASSMKVRPMAVLCGFGYFVRVYVYKYQEGIVLGHMMPEALVSRGQPPPGRRRRQLFRPSIGTIARMLDRSATIILHTQT